MSHGAQAALREGILPRCERTTVSPLQNSHPAKALRAVPDMCTNIQYLWPES